MDDWDLEMQEQTILTHEISIIRGLGENCCDMTEILSVQEEWFILRNGSR